MAQQEPVPQRIGDAERDAAVAALQEHHSQGRLSHDEFDERMSKALEAKVNDDLVGLFADLPEPKPANLGQRAWRRPAPPAPVDYTPTELTTPAAKPWFAQWWMILVAVGLTVVARGSVGFIVPMMAIWLWIIYPSLAGHRRRQPGVSSGIYPTVELTDWQRQQVEGELRRGNKINAVKIYRQYTGAGLLEAKNAVETLERQIGR